MTVRTLTQVGAFIATHSKPDPSQSPQEQYDHIEMLAIQVLDSDFDLYPEGALQTYLASYLDAKRKQLGI